MDGELPYMTTWLYKVYISVLLQDHHSYNADSMVLPLRPTVPAPVRSNPPSVNFQFTEHTHTHTLQIPPLQSPPFGSVGAAKVGVAPLPRNSGSHIHPPPASHTMVKRWSSADQPVSYEGSGFPEPPPRSITPQLKGLHDYEYIAVLGMGHFGKVSCYTEASPSVVFQWHCSWSHYVIIL